jgi:hypothetical protein
MNDKNKSKIDELELKILNEINFDWNIQNNKQR